MQTGVKSFGCENSTAHESPTHSWKSISPSVVSAVKSGASEPIVSAMSPPFGAALITIQMKAMPVDLSQLCEGALESRTWVRAEDEHPPVEHEGGDPSVAGGDGLRRGGVNDIEIGVGLEDLVGSFEADFPARARSTAGSPMFWASAQ